jgi:hypothetical protein
MHMLRHYDISDQTERMSAANFIQYLYKTVPRPNRTQRRPPPIATEGNEMKITLSVVPFERIAHRRKNQNPHP